MVASSFGSGTCHWFGVGAVGFAGLPDRGTAEALPYDLRWKAACG